MNVNVRDVGVGGVGGCILCTGVREEGGDEKSPDSETLSLLPYTLIYVSLADLGRPSFCCHNRDGICVLLIDKSRAKDETYI